MEENKGVIRMGIVIAFCFSSTLKISITVGNRDSPRSHLFYFHFYVISSRAKIVQLFSVNYGVGGSGCIEMIIVLREMSSWW